MNANPCFHRNCKKGRIDGNAPEGCRSSPRQIADQRLSLLELAVNLKINDHAKNHTFPLV